MNGRPGATESDVTAGEGRRVTGGVEDDRAAVLLVFGGLDRSAVEDDRRCRRDVEVFEQRSTIDRSIKPCRAAAADNEAFDPRRRALYGRSGSPESDVAAGEGGRVASGVENDGPGVELVPADSNRGPVQRDRRGRRHREILER